MTSFNGIRNSTKTHADRKLNSNKVSDIRIFKASKICNEIKEKKLVVPTLGPRTKFLHYVFDLRWDLNKAVNEILKEYSVLDKDIVLKWLEEENKKKKKGRMNSDEGR